MFDDDQDVDDDEEFEPAPPEPDYGLPQLLADLHAPWRERAACRGKPTWWFFPFGSLDAHPRAKALCAGCPVRHDCLDDALRSAEQLGYWGGASERERRRIRQHRRIRAQRAARGLT